MKRTLGQLGYAIAAVPLSFAPASRQRLATRLSIEQRRVVPVPLLPALGALLAAVLVLFLTWSSWLYPLRPDAIVAIDHPFSADPRLDNAWGGPTLIGAWFVHAMAAFGMQVVLLAAIRRLNGYHGRVPSRSDPVAI